MVWKTKGPVKAQPWSPFIPGNDKKKDEPALMADKKELSSAAQGRKGPPSWRPFFISLCRSAWALDRAQVEKLASDDNDEKIAAIAALVAEGDPKAADVLRQAAEGEITIDGKKVEVVMNNRVRGADRRGAFGFEVAFARTRGERLEAAKALAGGADAAMLPLVLRAKEKEADPEIKALLEMTAAGMQLKSEDRAERLAAVAHAGVLQQQDACCSKPRAMPTRKIRLEAQKGLRAVEARLTWGEWLGLAFAGASLGSILLLAALGLAITYGLMGVINMAHGELIMIGAYTTYVVQNFFRGMPVFDWYLLAAIPAAFIVSGAGRHGARALGDPLALRPAAGDAARDLGHQPDADPGGAHDLRRAERAGREPVVHVGRHPGAFQRRAALEPHHDHRFRRLPS